MQPSIQRRVPTPTAQSFPRRARALPGAVLLGVLIVWGAASGCQDNDLGHCCPVLPGRDMSILPVPDKADGGSSVRTDPAIDCENFACVTYQGSNPYCTQTCISSASCPSDFTCEEVIHADPPPVRDDAGVIIDASSIDKKYCVKSGLNACIK